MNIKDNNKKSDILKCILVFVLGLIIGGVLWFTLDVVFINNKNDSVVTDIPDIAYRIEKFALFNLKEDDHYYNLSFGDDDISYVISGEDMKKCTVKINKERANLLFNSFGVNINSTEKYVSVDVNFDTPVRSVMTAGRGHTFVSDDTAMLFLMQDGTVRYLKLARSLASPEFNANYSALPTPKKVEGLDHVIAIYQGSERFLTPGVIGGAVETFAVRDDGAVINLLDYTK